MKFLKILGILVGIIIIIVAGIAIYLKTFLPDTGKPEDIRIDITKARLERGEYLANHVAVCIDCHSQRDWSVYSGPIISGTTGSGGERFPREFGFPGTFIAKNITPYHLGNWTDGEILRAVTTGVNKDGKALFPIMGYLRFGKMDKEDIYSIIAYIRSLAPVKSENPESEADFPVNFLLNTMPEPASFTEIPDASDKVKYGQYLVNAAGCVECHSKAEKGKTIPGTEYGGGFEFRLPMGTARSANISPDKETGIGTWTSDMFVSRFKQFVDSNYVPQKLQPGEVNTPMPWMMYAGMTSSDLEAIFAYLQTVKPIENKVVKFEKAKL
jgi:mono/diheme cytochrome c family protein